MSDDHSARMEEAIRLATGSRGGSLATIASRYYSSLTASGYLRVCPFCQDKGQTFCIKRATAGHWYWGCHKSACPVNFDKLKGDATGDTIGFLMVHEGWDRSTALDKLLELAGIPNPRADLPKKKAKRIRKGSPKPAPAVAVENPPRNPETADPASTSEDSQPATDELFAIPESAPPTADPGFSLKDGVPPPPPDPIEKTVWDDIWERLFLSASDREVLKSKRGFTSMTIEQLGFRSSGRGNRSLLQPILLNWPMGMLLGEGIATKDAKTGEFKINSQLCGWGLQKRGGTTREDEWGWTEPILIPYFSETGQVIAIRPHKGGLSGKRHMQEQGYELGFRNKRTRTKPYFNRLIWNQPEAWEGRCVLTEGEFKGGALEQCGIPAAAAPGIQMPRNVAFLEELAESLKAAGIKEVIVCFDNEDKSQKPDPWMRHEAEVYALYACHALRSKGLWTSYVSLPDAWQIDGKADWDGALAAFGSKAKQKFEEVLKSAKRYFPQGDLFGLTERQRIIHCKLNRLIMDPKILTGGEDEEDLARLILRTTMPYRMLLDVQALAQELFETRGCYFIAKKKSYRDLRDEYKILAKIKEEIEETPDEDLKTRASLDAALAAVHHVIDGRPEVLSDFTIECEFLLRKSDGTSEQLMRFTNKHGQKSPIISVPSSCTATSSRFREFCGTVGNFNPIIGDRHLQMLKIDLGYLSAWREIRELEMIGMDPESGLWIFGDCAFTRDGDVLFADDHDVIWHDGIGYRIDPDDLKDFVHRDAPKFFQALGSQPHEVLAEIAKDPEAEEREVAAIFFQLAADLICTFGDGAGLLVFGVILGYAMAPDLLQKYHGHPGLWIHGRAFAGKTETAAFLMQLWGYAAEYRNATLSSGTTNVGIDRWLAQYCNILMHLDEFRQTEADKARIASLRMPFNRQAKGKGKLDQTNKTRSVQPMTSPMVTGEGVTNDSATLSRYVEVILAVDRRRGNKSEQIARYERMKSQSGSYHRILRWILMRRKWFAAESLRQMDRFTQEETTTKAISSDRLRITYGAAFSGFISLWNHFAALCLKDRAHSPLAALAEPDQKLLNATAKDLEAFTVDYAKKASADVASINFVVKFWTNVMDLYQRDTNSMKRFIWFEWCQIHPLSNRVTRTNAKRDAEGHIRCIIINWSPLYSEVERDLRQRGTEPDLTLSNIRRETTTERYYVPGPKDGKNGSHRMTMEKSQVTVSVLRCDQMDPSLRQVFDDRFETDDEDSLSF